MLNNSVVATVSQASPAISDKRNVEENVFIFDGLGKSGQGDTTSSQTTAILQGNQDIFPPHFIRCKESTNSLEH